MRIRHRCVSNHKAKPASEPPPAPHKSHLSKAIADVHGGGRVGRVGVGFFDFVNFYAEVDPAKQLEFGKKKPALHDGAEPKERLALGAFPAEE